MISDDEEVEEDQEVPQTQPRTTGQLSTQKPGYRGEFEEEVVRRQGNESKYIYFLSRKRKLIVYLLFFTSF